jgi:hypothetical protein
MCKLFAVLLALLAMTQVALAEEDAPKHKALEDVYGARGLTDAFMDLAVAGKIQEAFDSVMPYWPVSEAQIGAVVLQTIRQRELVIGAFGGPRGMEFLREDRLGESFLRFVYLEKRENHALAWIFIFYSADGATWQLNSLIWNDKVPEFF